MKCTTFVFCAALLPSIFCGCPDLNVDADDGYYWRDYNGEIPEDAIKVGVKANGKSLYIGYTLKEKPSGAFVVGHIDPEIKKLIYPYEGSAYDATDNIKILCSQYPENFHWVTGTFEELRDYHKNALVVGGYDTWYPLYIGRVQEDDGGVIPGKLSLDPAIESFGYIVGKRAIFIKSGFDALAYKPGISHKTRRCKEFNSGYYWRDYNGEIPEDAIKLGVKANGKSLYIGSTLKDKPYGALLIGHIDPEKKKLIYPYEGYAYDVTDNIKILCSQHPENFHWITNTFAELRDHHKNELVVGGYDTYPLYIGRIQQDDGGVIPGKLTLDPTLESFAYIVGKQAIFIKSGFDSLTYKPGKSGRCKEFISGYYWRDYNGEMPEDALEVGVKANGKGLYIGSTLKEKPTGALVVGYIDPEIKKLIYPYEQDIYNVTDNIKILCSQYPENFHWITGTFAELRDHHKNELVVGGYDTWYPLYIGRVKEDDGGVKPGKLSLDPAIESFGNIVGSQATFIKSGFEALTYEPRQSHKGYYWRDYNGEIPEDAIKVGLKANGKSLYIGSTLKDKPYGALVVGHIDPEKKKLIYPFEGYAYDVSENIKILCSQYPENFHWITYTFAELRDHHKNELVVGGYDTYPLYIGRVQEDDGGVIPGKLTLDPTYESFAYIVGKQAIFIKSGFDALTYKPGKSGRCKEFISDYYWRDYNGEMPDDALEVGVKANGKGLYIGSTLKEKPTGALVVGYIDPEIKKLIYPYEQYIYNVTDNIKILCSQYPENFRWITGTFAQLRDHHTNELVVGGYDTWYPLYIGRVKEDDGGVKPGKLSLDSAIESVGHIVGNQSIFIKSNFDALTYEPRKCHKTRCHRREVHIKIFN